MKKLFLFLMLLFPLLFATEQKQSQRVFILPIVGEINYVASAFVARAKEQAIKEKPEFLLVELDTPGGEVGATLRIVTALREIAKAGITTVAYITPRKGFEVGAAWSAGALIALSCQKIFMSRGTSMGAAEPIMIGPEGPIPVGEKFVSALRGHFASIAEENGYPKNLAIKMIDKELEVWDIEIDKKVHYVDTYEKEKLIKEGKVKAEDFAKEPVYPKGKLLTLRASEAKKVGIATEIVDSRAKLYEVLGITSPVENELIYTWSEHVVGVLTNPVVSMILLIVGIMGIWIEIKTPGFGLPGTVGLICLGLFFFGHYLVGLAEVTEILLFVMGILLIVAEIFVLPFYGILAIAGILCVIASLVLAFHEFTVPDVIQVDIILLSLLKVLSAFLIAAVVLFLFLKFLPHLPIINKIVLKAQVSSQASQISVAGEIYLSLVNKIGVAITDLRPAGKVEIDKQVFDVITDGEYVEKGQKIIVVKVEGSKIIVSRQ